MAGSALDTEIKDVRAFLRILYLDGKKWESNRHHKSAPSYTSVEGKIISNSSEFTQHVETKNWNGEGSFEKDKYILIRPSSKDDYATTAIWCRWDFSQSPIKFGCYLGIWSRYKTDLDVPNPLKFLGSRYESPEPTGREHRYHHMQPCRSMGAKDDEPIHHAVPVNTRYPTVALPANKPSEMLFCLALSLYRAEELAQLKSILEGERDLVRQSNLRRLFEHWVEQVDDADKLTIWQSKQPRAGFGHCDHKELNFGAGA
ncbi:hypothetical protein [Maricaulis maris]|uniref:hypothetical protein n=1 Tax=Maricaulis maris TaxID=74318 RepID=UPI003A9070D2